MTFLKKFFKDWIGEMILLSCTWRPTEVLKARVNFGRCFVCKYRGPGYVERPKRSRETLCLKGGGGVTSE